MLFEFLNDLINEKISKSFVCVSFAGINEVRVGAKSINEMLSSISKVECEIKKIINPVIIFVSYRRLSSMRSFIEDFKCLGMLSRREYVMSKNNLSDRFHKKVAKIDRLGGKSAKKIGLENVERPYTLVQKLAYLD